MKNTLMRDKDSVLKSQKVGHRYFNTLTASSVVCMGTNWVAALGWKLFTASFLLQFLGIQDYTWTKSN